MNVSEKLRTVSRILRDHHHGQVSFALFHDLLRDGRMVAIGWESSGVDVEDCGSESESGKETDL